MTVLVAVGCSSGDGRPAAQGPPPTALPSAPPTPPTPARPPTPSPTVVATAQVPSVAVFDAPDGPAASTSFANPNEWDLPLVFRVEAVLPDWVKVMLSARPNGSTGWVRASDVSISENDWRMQVELGSRRLTVWKGADVVREETVAIGKADAPSPTGDYYLTAMIPTGNDAGPYGPWAIGVSAFSDVYTSFAGGPGQVGLHGTNQPELLGDDVSNGCIRITNEAITALAEQVPPGAPIAIVA
ncbi:MAG: L,D-transpeptidase [Acidimicrobiales bacterium]